MRITIPAILLGFCASIAGILSSPSARPPGKTYSMKEPREAAESGPSRKWHRTQSAIVSSQLGTESETERKAAELRRRLEEWMDRGANGGNGSKTGEVIASSPDYSETDQETDQEYRARRRTKTDRRNGRRSRENDDDPRITMAMKESKRESDERQKHIREQEKRKQIVMYDQDSRERIDSDSRRRDHGRNECAAESDQRTKRKERLKQVTTQQSRGKQIEAGDQERLGDEKQEMKIIEKRKEPSYLDRLIESERIKAEKEAAEVEPYNEPNSMWSSSWHERNTHRSKSQLALSHQSEKYDDKRRKYYDQDQNSEKPTGVPFSRSFSSISHGKTVGAPNRQQQQIVPCTPQRNMHEQFWDLNVQYTAKLKECEKAIELKRAELPRAQSMHQVRPTGVSKEGRMAKMVKRVASLTKESVKEAKRREAEKRNTPKGNSIKRWPTRKYQAEPSSGSNNVRKTAKEPLLLEYHQSPKTGIGKKHCENMKLERSSEKKNMMNDQESEQEPRYPTDDEEEAQMAIVLVKSLEEHEASYGTYGDQEEKKENREEELDKIKGDQKSGSDNDEPNLANLDEDSLLALAIVKSLEESDEQHTEIGQYKKDAEQQPIEEETYIPIEYIHNKEKYGQRGYEYEDPYSGKDVYSEQKNSMIDLDEDAELALAMQESLQMNRNQGVMYEHDQQNDKQNQSDHPIKGSYDKSEDEPMDDDIRKAIQASLNEEPQKGQNSVPAENRYHGKSSSRIRYPTFADRIGHGKFKLKSDQSHTSEQYGHVSQPDYTVKGSCKGNEEDETMDDDIRKAIQASLNEEPHEYGHESNSDHPIKGTCHENDDIRKAIKASLNEQSHRGPTRIPAGHDDQSSSSSRVRYPTFTDRIRHGKLKLELDLSLYSQEMLGRMGISRRRN